MDNSELAIETVATESLGCLTSLPPGTMSVVRRAFSTPERNQKQSNPSDNSRKEFWKIVGVGVAGALCGVADSPQNQPSWKGAMHGAGSALSSWAEKRSEEFDNEEIYYDHKVALSTQNEEFAYLSSSRSLADAHSESYSNVNLQQSLTVGEKTVLAANDLRKSGYYASSRFNDVVETALTGHPNERVRAIKKVGADLEYYKGY